MILGLLLLYEWVVVGQLQIWRTGIVAYEFHAVDFSMGFGSFILPGAVYQRICGPINESSLTVYHTVLLLVFFFVLRLFRSGADADRKKRNQTGRIPEPAAAVFLLLPVLITACVLFALKTSTGFRLWTLPAMIGAALAFAIPNPATRWLFAGGNAGDRI